MADTESCTSKAVDFAPNQSRKQWQKIEVYNEVLCRLRDLNIEEASFPAFEDELWVHFSRLPTRYPTLIPAFKYFHFLFLSLITGGICFG